MKFFPSYNLHLKLLILLFGQSLPLSLICLLHKQDEKTFLILLKRIARAHCADIACVCLSTEKYSVSCLINESSVYECIITLYALYETPTRFSPASLRFHLVSSFCHLLIFLSRSFYIIQSFFLSSLFVSSLSAEALSSIAYAYT